MATKKRTQTVGFTLDDHTSKDLDDGVVVEVTPKGTTIRVSIADVADAVVKGSKTDLEARKRVETRYFAQGNDPMLPRELSERKCSLLPGHWRKVVTTEITLDGDLEVVEGEISRRLFKSTGQLSYQDVPRLLSNPPGETFREHLEIGINLAENLLARRRNGGALVLYDLDSGWVSTEEGFLKQMRPEDVGVGYIFIQELMILVNQFWATWCAEREIPVLFRNHTAKPHAPDREILRDLILQAQNVSISGFHTLREQVYLTVNRANYGVALEGHFGLNLPGYMHTTSPIRRYADLVNQRQMVASLEGVVLPYTVDELNDVAQEINAWHEARRETAEARGKRSAQSQVAGDLAVQGFASLGNKRFDQVVRTVAQGRGVTVDAFFTDFLRRLGDRSATILSKTVVLFEAPKKDLRWQGLREAVVAGLGKDPTEAVSILTMANQLMFLDPAAVYHQEESGEDHNKVFKTRAVGGGVTGASRVAGTAKLAKQRAAVALLSLMNDLPVPEFSVKIMEVGSSRQNPVSELGELCQGMHQTLPVYDFERVGGEDNVPVWKAVCSAMGVSREVQGVGAKKALKMRVAAQVLGELTKGGGV